MILFNNFKRLKISDYCSPFEASNVVDSTAEIAYIAPEVSVNYIPPKYIIYIYVYICMHKYSGISTKSI